MPEARKIETGKEKWQQGPDRLLQFSRGRGVAVVTQGQGPQADILRLALAAHCHPVSLNTTKTVACSGRPAPDCRKASELGRGGCHKAASTASRICTHAVTSAGSASPVHLGVSSWEAISPQ